MPHKTPGACTVLTYSPCNLIEVKYPWTFKEYLLILMDIQSVPAMLFIICVALGRI